MTCFGFMSSDLGAAGLQWHVAVLGLCSCRALGQCAAINTVALVLGIESLWSSLRMGRSQHTGRRA